jgi:uncharacterized membrane protein HdeD (DUF308 family)
VIWSIHSSKVRAAEKVANWRPPVWHQHPIRCGARKEIGAIVDATLSALNHVAPWRRGVGWKVVLVEGIVALAIGLVILSQPDTARTTIRQLLGGALLLTSALVAGAAFFAVRDGERRDPGAPFRLFGGGIGVTLGLLVVLEPSSPSIAGDVGRHLLTAGLLAFGLFDLIGAIAAFPVRGIRLGALLNGALYAGLGLLLLLNTQTAVVRVEMYGALTVAVGLLLIGYAFWLRRRLT